MLQSIEDSLQDRKKHSKSIKYAFLCFKLLKSIPLDTVFNWSYTDKHPPYVLTLIVE